MKKIPQKRKEWFDRHAQDIDTKNQKKRTLNVIRVADKIISRTVIAPNVLSIIYNQDETIKFFRRIINDFDELWLTYKRKRYYIDISNVETITADAIMYLIIIISDYKGKDTHNHEKLEVCGNAPANENAKKYFMNSGFYNYVKSNYKTKMSSENVQISKGRHISENAAKAICEFTMNRLDRSRCPFLYAMLIEFMENTESHAYRPDIYHKFVKEWYLYAEYADDKISYTFVDTGIGIPFSINRRFLERIYARDDLLILSTLRGENRTETKEAYRGKGLPHIYKCAKHGEISNFHVVSGKGTVNVTKSSETSGVHDNVIGTVFYWEITIKENDYEQL